MKVLIVNTGCLPAPPLRGGAIELHTYYLANALAGLGYKVSYVSDLTSLAMLSRDVRVYEVGYSRGSFQSGFITSSVNNIFGGYRAYRAASKALRREHIDIIHFHDKVSGAFFRILCKKSKTPIVYTMHNPMPQSYGKDCFKLVSRGLAFKALEFRVINNASAIITVSRALKNELVTNWGIEERKVHYVPNGVDVTYFSPNNNPSYIRGSIVLPEDFLLFVGKLEKRKGVDILLRAVNGTKINVVVVGAGPEKTYLTDLARELGLANQVFFLGSVQGELLRKIYAAASFFVLPSLGEGFPLVVLEAMASGLPIIATKTGFSDAVIDGYNGFVVFPSDVKSVHRKILLLSEDSKLRRIMGKRSRRIAEQEFSWTNVANKVAQIYDSLLC